MVGWVRGCVGAWVTLLEEEEGGEEGEDVLGGLVNGTNDGHVPCVGEGFEQLDDEEGLEEDGWVGGWVEEEAEVM